jgi:epoxyqueuosine reductase
MVVDVTANGRTGDRHPPFRHRLVRPLHRAIELVVFRVMTPTSLKRLRVVPSLPAWFRRRYEAVTGPWPAFDRDTPERLRSVAGIKRDPAVEDRVHREDPLHSFHHNYPRSVMWALARLWQSMLPVAPRLMRAIARAQATADAPAVAVAAHPLHRADAGSLTEQVRDRAGTIGLSTVGIASHDPRYTFADLADEVAGETIVVCILEQNWAATQALPGPVGEQTALSTNAELMEMAARLATAIQQMGYRARAHTTEGMAIVHHYAVEAGLGQLGYNGQLLTPQAGSRCRIALISTDAPLRRDQPRDLGIPRICATCRACVRRCPSQAIPSRPAMYRGVEKAKLDLARCFPVVAQVNGCSVCMKVCPVQRYGLARVHEHFEETGRILGVGTDELEGYDWPIDGLHYGPGERPELPGGFFDVPGFGKYAADPDAAPEVTHNPLM